VIDQARLWFREGTSDKVYEVDLVEVAPNQHVINFRFGRRGSALRDGGPDRRVHRHGPSVRAAHAAVLPAPRRPRAAPAGARGVARLCPDGVGDPAHDADAPIGSLLAFLRKVVTAEGFTVHPDTIRVVRRGRRQEVTGVVVNEKPAVVRAELRRFRALLYQIEKDGPAGKRWGHGGDVLAAALGFASYVAMVDPEKGAPLRAKVLELRTRYPRAR